MALNSVGAIQSHVLFLGFQSAQASRSIQIPFGAAAAAGLLMGYRGLRNGRIDRGCEQAGGS